MGVSGYTNLLDLAAKSCGGFVGKRVLDVGCDFSGTVVTALKNDYEALEAVGLNLSLPTRIDLAQHCRIEPGDIRQTDYPDAYFDVIISVSAFEHIRDFEVALQEMHRILKPGGFLFSHFGPIWSASYGHHLWLSCEGETYSYWNVPLPPYCHLLMTESEILDWCQQRFDPELSQIIANYVLHSSEQNQLFFEDYAAIVERSPFQTHRFQPYRHPELNSRYQAGMSAEILDQLKHQFPAYQNFDADGIEMLLQRSNIAPVEAETPAKLLFFAPYGEWLVHNQVDAVLALALQQRGCEVAIIGCDGIYPNCAITARDAEPQQSERCQACAASGQGFFQRYDLPYLQLRSWMHPSDIEIAAAWVESLDPADYRNACFQNLPIGQWVTSTVNTYFRISSAEEFARPDVRRVHRQYLIDGLVTYWAVCRLLDAYQPTRIVLFNGRFAPYRVALEAARQRQLEVLVHERGLIDDSFIFFNNSNCLSSKPILELAAAWQDMPLQEAELQQVKQYFLSREQGKNLNWTAFYNFQTDYAAIRQKLALPTDARVFVVFTSSADEIATAEDYAGVNQQLELVDRLIEIFAEREEYLVIRHHPWIGGNTAHPATMDFLTAAYQQAQRAPQNVRIIMPHEPLTSYALFWHTDAAIAFFSTIALEAAARGIPIANVAGSRYSPALSQTITATDRSSLEALVEALLTVPTPAEQVAHLRRLYRFTYSCFFRFCKTFRAFGIKNFYSADLRFQQVKDLHPGYDLELDRICQHLIQGTSLHALPEGASAPPEPEAAFLQGVLTEISATRQQVQQVTQHRYSISNSTVAVICLNYSDDDCSDENPSAWMKQSRHSQLNLHICAESTWGNYQNIVQDTLKVIKLESAEYILVTNPYIQYDEAFLSTALDQLDNQPDKAGVLAGAWLATPQRGIYSSIFTPAVPARTYQEAVQVLPLLQYPLALLGQALIRRDMLLQFLHQLQEQTAPQAAEFAFRWLTANVDLLELPMMLIQQTPQQQLRGLELERFRLTSNLEQSQLQLQQVQQTLETTNNRLQQIEVQQHDARQQIQNLQQELTESRQQKQTQQAKLKQVRTELKQIRQALSEAEAVISSMKTSKFWRLRSGWIKLKQMMGWSE